MGIFMITLLVGAASFATAGVPDLAQSTAARAYLGPETAVLFNAPNGGGSAFTEAVTGWSNWILASPSAPAGMETVMGTWRSMP